MSFCLYFLDDIVLFCLYVPLTITPEFCVFCLYFPVPIVLFCLYTIPILFYVPDNIV